MRRSCTFMPIDQLQCTNSTAIYYSQHNRHLHAIYSASSTIRITFHLSFTNSVKHPFRRLHCVKMMKKPRALIVSHNFESRHLICKVDPQILRVHCMATKNASCSWDAWPDMIGDHTAVYLSSVMLLQRFFFVDCLLLVNSFLGQNIEYQEKQTYKSLLCNHSKLFRLI